MEAAFGPFRFNLETLEIRKFGVRQPLEEKPARLLVCLIERRGTLVSRQDLISYLWQDGVNVDFDHGLNKAVNKLRGILGDEAGKPLYLETLSRRGYRFVADVEIISEPETVSAGADGISESANGDSGHVAITPASETAATESLPEEDPENKGGSRLAAAIKIRSKHKIGALLAVTAVLVIGAALNFADWNRRSNVSPLRAVVTLPPNLRLITRHEGGIAISPDGTLLVFDAVGPEGRARLWLRRFDSLVPEPIPGTEGGAFPFWSPDGKSLGFFTGQELKRLNLSDHTVATLCSAYSGRGGTWSQDGTILFARETQTPIFRIKADGGKPEAITHLDLARYTTHRWPVFLPDQQHFVFLAANHNESARPGALYLSSLTGGDPILLGESDSNAFAVGGSLLFLSHGKLIAQQLNLSRGTLDQHAEIVAEGIEYDPGSWYGTFAATPSALIYHLRPEHNELQVISWFDSKGNKLGAAGRPGVFGGLSLSPDGKTIATICGDPEFNICLIHEDGTVTQLTQHGLAGGLAWAPDSSALSYGVHEGNTTTTFIKPLDGNVPARILSKSYGLVPAITSWHPDKQHVLALQETGNANIGLVTLDLATGATTTYLSPVPRLYDSRFSPDGNWIAYQSGMDGTDKIRIASYPNPVKQYVVSAERSVAPRWRGDGRELYFLGPDELIYAVTIAKVADGLVIGAPRRLFHPPMYPFASDYVSYDVTRDGTRFLVITMADSDRSELVLTTGWRP